MTLRNGVIAEGTITDIQAGGPPWIVTVQLGDHGSAISGVRCIAGYVPVVNGATVVAVDQGQALAIGSTIGASTATSGPRLQFDNDGILVNDGTVTRVQIGDLAADGNSPAQIGMRVNDASGNPIFDSLGMIQAAIVVGTASFASAGPLAFTTAFTTIGATQTASFTLSRPQNLLVIGMAPFYTSGGTASYGYMRLVLLSGTSISQSSSALTHTNGSGVSNGSGHVYCASVPAGTYTAAYQYRLDAGATTTLVIGTGIGGGGQVDVIQLGG
jgi:hypothetical protein